MKKLLSVLIVICLVALSFTGLEKANRFFSDYAKAREQVVTDPPLVYVQPNFIDVLFLGHGRVYQNFLAIWTAQILLNEKLNVDEAEKLTAYIEKVSKHKPLAVNTVYIGTCLVLMQSLKKPLYCRRVLEAGMEARPNSWQIPFILAFVEGFVLKNYERSSFFYYVASIKEDAPESVKGMVKKYLGKEAKPSDQELLESMDNFFRTEEGSRFVEFMSDAIKERTVE